MNQYYRPRPANTDRRLPRQHQYFVYIMTDRSGTLYTGVTNSLEVRVIQHRNAPPATFTGRYKIGRLMWYEEHGDIRTAIAREKEIKGWTRGRKIQLIAAMNPGWRDLTESWGWPRWDPESVTLALDRAVRSGTLPLPGSTIPATTPTSRGGNAMKFGLTTDTASGPLPKQPVPAKLPPLVASRR